MSFISLWYNIYVALKHFRCYIIIMNSQELKRYLIKHGCSFTSGKGGHLLVKRGSKKSVLPMHGTRKELGTGLVQKILKDLDLK